MSEVLLYQLFVCQPIDLRGSQWFLLNLMTSFSDMRLF
ncbi:uncharacterized protein METZ01_LOCUS354309 [marine metagenome]|uniref:Uncharacterized protein n=1 Tax=marine metagenome TaxID=408172 RepID=A0A382RWC3_9ZZZZ